MSNGAMSANQVARELTRRKVWIEKRLSESGGTTQVSILNEIKALNYAIELVNAKARENLSKHES